MRNINEARFPKPIRSDPSQRDLNLWCEYHGTHGHRTGDCRNLRKEVATLLKNGHLREFNGVTFSAAKKTKISVTHNKRLREVTEDDITFMEEDADGLVIPHNDALESQPTSSDGECWSKKKLTGSIIPTTKLLVRFNLTNVTTQVEILLATNTKGLIKTNLLEVVDGDMGYNIILVRLWIHEMKVVPSTYHQLLKFPTPEGIKADKRRPTSSKGDERSNYFHQ
ncbi:uncharacterized protein LOC142180011 [Nicotiana tabacum]|uniref:Uncharacterized protein LOC142180011 n=1 Tax=Nicotiana tabacum TaxID=4097 RepID=A0AC58UCR0_TOBAC